MAHDVVVIGGGNAALCAALAAREGGASVLVLEKAPESERGGNSFFTAGGFRFAHQGLEDLRRDVIPDLSDEEARTITIPAYTEDQYYDDLMRVTEGRSDLDLAQHLVQRSKPTVMWMRTQGIRWILMFSRQSYKVGDRHHFWGGLTLEAVGGGPGLVEALFERAAKVGIEVRYGVAGHKLILDSSGRVTGVVTRSAAGASEIPCRAVVIASGGFEANRSGARDTSDPTGTWRACAAPATTWARASRWRWRSGRRPTATGRPATRWRGISMPPPSATGAWATCSRSTRTRSG